MVLNLGSCIYYHYYKQASQRSLNSSKEQCLLDKVIEQLHVFSLLPSLLRREKTQKQNMLKNT